MLMIRPTMFPYQLYWHFPAKFAHVNRWKDSSQLSVNLEQFEYLNYHELCIHTKPTLKEKCWFSELNF